MNTDQRINEVAKEIYNANWKELPNGRFPPVWENASNEVRAYVKNQARAAIERIEAIKKWDL